MSPAPEGNGLSYMEVAIDKTGQQAGTLGGNLGQLRDEEERRQFRTPPEKPQSGGHRELEPCACRSPAFPAELRAAPEHCTGSHKTKKKPKIHKVKRESGMLFSGKTFALHIRGPRFHAQHCQKRKKNVSGESDGGARETIQRAGAQVLFAYSIPRTIFYSHISGTIPKHQAGHSPSSPRV